jgi:hypothetical protein
VIREQLIQQLLNSLITSKKLQTDKLRVAKQWLALLLTRRNSVELGKNRQPIVAEQSAFRQ